MDAFNRGDLRTVQSFFGKDLGTVDAGGHSFYTRGPGQPERITATAKFVNVWKREGEKWRIVRAVSYDHE